MNKSVNVKIWKVDSNVKIRCWTKYKYWRKPGTVTTANVRIWNDFFALHCIGSTFNPLVSVWVLSVLSSIISNIGIIISWSRYWPGTCWCSPRWASRLAPHIWVGELIVKISSNIILYCCWSPMLIFHLWVRKWVVVLIIWFGWVLNCFIRFGIIVVLFGVMVEFGIGLSWYYGYVVRGRSLQQANQGCFDWY